jgi:hypothetical protein
MKYTPPIKRIPTRYGHYYKDGANNRVPGVTTILNGGMPKQFLIEWAGNKSAEIAVDCWDELTDLPPTKRLELIKSRRKQTENLAKNKGTRVHAIAEQVVQGHPAIFEGADEETLLRPYVENYVRFIDMWQIEPVLVEVVLVNYSVGFAGTLDLVADLKNPASGETERWLLDLKTGEKGIFAETALQLAAYRNAQFYVDNDGAEQPMLPIQVDHCAAINVTAEDCLFVPVVADDQAFKTFRFAQKLYEFDKDKDGYVQPPIMHPHTSTVKVEWNA